jgi:serine/threonine protein kinase
MKDSTEGAIEQAARLADGQKLDDAALRDLDPQVARGLQRLAILHQPLAADAPMGASWGHLHQLDFVARGGFGDVYRAYDPTLERTVALKLRRDDLPVVISSGRDLLAEARRLARVRHPHVLAVHGASYHGGRAGIWADWIDGETLQQYLLHATPTATEVLSWARELASALAAIHEAGLVHGDIKAGNVMRDRRGHLVLMDFGAGFASDGEGAVLGGATPRYLAPEIMRGQAPSAAIDIYALGVLLHWLATRAFPQAGRVAAAVRPRALRTLLQAMLANEPGARPDAAGLAQHLQALEQAPLKRARRIALFAMAAALVAISVVSTLAYRRARSEHAQTQSALEHADTTNRFLTDLIERASAGALGPNASLRDLLDAAPGMVRERFAARPGDRSRLLHLLSEVEYSLSNDQTAARLAADAADAAVADAAGADNTLMRIGDALRLAVYLDDATTASQRAQALLQRARDEMRDPALIAYLEFCLIEIDYARSLTQSSPEAQHQLVERVQRLLTRTDLDAGVASLLWRRHSNLEVVRGDFTAALASAEKSVAVAESAYGSEHPRTAISRSVLGWLLLSYGRAGQAEQLFRSNIAMHERRVGRRSRVVVDYLIGLAYTLHIQGRDEEALQLAKEAHPISVALYGPLHRNAIDATITLAQTHLAVAGHQAATALLTALRADLLAAGKHENRQFLQVLELLASARLPTDATRSLQLLEECATIGTRALGAENALTRRCGLLAAALRDAIAIDKVPRDLDALLQPAAK